MVRKSTILQVLCQCFVFLLLTTQNANSQMTVGEYSGAMMACWTPYIMSIMEPLLQMGTQGKRKKRQVPIGTDAIAFGIAQSFKASCGDTLDRAVQCHQKVDGWAGYRLVNTERLKSVIQQLCNRVDTLGTDFQCIPNDKVNAMVGCLSQVVYSNSVCGVTTQLKNCVLPVFSDCVAGMQALFNNIVDLVSIDRCVDTALPSAETCTGVGSLTTVASCYTSFITKMVIGGPAAKETFLALCADGTVNTAMDCHEAVQDFCSISYVNMDEMKMMVTHTCANLDTQFDDFGVCLNVTDAFGFLTCINKLQASGDVCAVTNGYDSCTMDAFNRCNMPIQKLMEYGFDLISVPCPDGSCSRIEHAATLAMCWYPTISALIPWDTIMSNAAAPYNFGTYFTALCTTHRSIITGTLDCHFAADDRCGWGIVTRDVADRFINAMCESPSSLMEIVTCVAPKLQDYNTCALELKDLNPLDDEYFCQINEHMQECVGILMSGCNQGIRDTFDTVMGIMLESGCTYSKTRTTPSAAGKNKPLELAVVTSLVLALNANLNGFVNDWMHMLGNMERQRNEL